MGKNIEWKMQMVIDEFSEQKAKKCNLIFKWFLHCHFLFPIVKILVHFCIMHNFSISYYVSML